VAAVFKAATKEHELMKEVLGLPGRNKETESWMMALLAACGVADAEVARYRHWQRDVEPNVAREADEYPVAGRALVVAKSMGTMVLLAAAENCFPSRAVLIGVPINAYTDDQIEGLRMLADRIPCLFIQQVDDFTGSAATLQEVLGESATVRVIAGADHVYADVDGLAVLITDWQAELDG
jgi:alpha/beta superfamily hydrolase